MRRSVAAVVLFCSFVTGQHVAGDGDAAMRAGAPAAATTGRFVDGEGALIAGARVWFAAEPATLGERASPVVVETTTDAQGRFTARLRRGVPHAVWAIADAGGAIDRSVVREPVFAGDVIELIGRRGPQRRPVSLESFAQLLPTAGARPGDHALVLEFVPGALHAPRVRVPIAAAALGEPFSLPVVPEGNQGLRLFDGDGRLLAPYVSDAWTRLELGRRNEFTVIVRDEEGRPVPGAIVEMLAECSVPGGSGPFARSRREPGRVVAPPTDETGATRILLFGQPAPVFAHRDGQVSALCLEGPAMPIRDGVIELPNPPPPWDPDAPWLLTLRRGPLLRLRVVRGEEPVAGCGVVADVQVSCRGEQGGVAVQRGFDDLVTATTDASGLAVFANAPRPVTSLQVRIDQFDGLPTVLLPRAASPEDPIVCDLAAWPVVTFDVRDATNGPPDGVRLVLGAAAMGEAATRLDVRAIDRSGRSRLRLEPGSWFVLASDGEHVAATMFEATRGEAKLALRLAPLPRCRGRIDWRDGTTAAGVRCRAQVFAAVGLGDVGDDPVARLLHHYEPQLQALLLREFTTDGDGHFDIPFLAVQGRERSLRVSVYAERGGSGVLDLVADERQALVLD